MLPTDVLNTLRALSLNERPLITPLPDKDTSGKDAFELGQKVQGAIQSQVSTGVFKVRVLEQMLQMQLPATFKSGDVIELQVISLQPRLTFSLSASTNPLSTPEQLSTTSRLLSTLSQQPLEKSFVRSLHSEPLMVVSDTPPDTKVLAGKLHESLSQSGLFYEAHQAQWIAGSRSTAQLLQEPQNQLTDPVKTALTSLTQAANPSAQSDHPMGIPNALQPLVQQQLNTLETRQVLWQGQVWPNQVMDWEIHEETPRSSVPRDVLEGGQWATQIRLDLPNLGEVAAMLRFSSQGLSITLDASGGQTRKLFGAVSSQLTAALAERGIKVSSTLVAPHDKS
jgi:hypothetical protein